MNFTSFTIRLLLLFLPGIISIILIDTFTIHRRWEGYKYFLYSFVLGLLCYLFWHLMKPVLLLIPYFVSEQDFRFFKSLVIEDFRIRYQELLFVLYFVTLPFSIIWINLTNNKYFFRLAQKTGLTKKDADEDVWSSIFNLETTEWVVIRDYEKNLIFEGWVSKFSESFEKKELLLMEVKVYDNNTSEYLYDVPSIYISFNSDKIIIEFPKT